MSFRILMLETGLVCTEGRQVRCDCVSVEVEVQIPVLLQRMTADQRMDRHTGFPILAERRSFAA